MKRKHSGRIKQTFIYLGKFFRMFVYQNDWKVMPMAALIAGLVSMVVGSNLFKTMEGTLMGSFALACICIWNGFFNSIQVVCRERAIIKREHRSGMYISSYIAAHMIYQAFLCICQTVITLYVCHLSRMAFPARTLFTKSIYVDLGISLFLTTYCADMLALMFSSIAKTTTAAMTVMPFLLIIQLVFSGGIFTLPPSCEFLTNVTIAKWGLTAMCSQGEYNDLPMVSIWNNAVKMKNIEVEGEKPLKEALIYIEEQGYRETILYETAKNNQNDNYEFSKENVLRSWEYLLFFAFLYALIAVISLSFIDKDKR